MKLAIAAWRVQGARCKMRRFVRARTLHSAPRTSHLALRTAHSAPRTAHMAMRMGMAMTAMPSGGSG
jgi:hypothetical protein